MSAPYKILLSTAENVPGCEVIEVLGLVKGNTIRSRHIGQDIAAGFRNVVGGEVSNYTKMLAEAREQAIDRMIDEATELGADAIIMIRFASAEVMKSAAELLVYGTAVRLRKP